MNLLSLTMAICAALVAHWFGYRHGVEAERQRVLHGMRLARSYVSSRALDLLAGWIWKDIDEKALCDGMEEYGGQKRAKHEAEQLSLLKRLGRHEEKP